MTSHIRGTLTGVIPHEKWYPGHGSPVYQTLVGGVITSNPAGSGTSLLEPAGTHGRIKGAPGPLFRVSGLANVRVNDR
jgi:hypothetical protein